MFVLLFVLRFFVVEEAVMWAITCAFSCFSSGIQKFVKRKGRERKAIFLVEFFFVLKEDTTKKMWKGAWYKSL